MRNFALMKENLPDRSAAMGDRPYAGKRLAALRAAFPYTLPILAAATALTRFLPFIVFRGKKAPGYITYLSQVLPPAVFGMLVVYCLKDVDFTRGHYGAPELIGIAVTCALHMWKRQMLISILGGTVTYMLLVQFVWV